MPGVLGQVRAGAGQTVAARPSEASVRPRRVPLGCLGGHHDPLEPGTMKEAASGLGEAERLVEPILSAASLSLWAAAPGRRFLICEMGAWNVQGHESDGGDRRCLMSLPWEDPPPLWGGHATSEHQAETRPWLQLSGLPGGLSCQGCQAGAQLSDSPADTYTPAWGVGGGRAASWESATRPSADGWSAAPWPPSRACESGHLRGTVCSGFREHASVPSQAPPSRQGGPRLPLASAWSRGMRSCHRARGRRAAPQSAND